jgi:hypothetical protein|tara:strand:+ start:29 stop:313 length:285 start_codon:yes stop_codon:yes gene_type:complete
MRFLDGKRIPKKVLTPDNRNLGSPSRQALVYGISVIDKCPNPDCGQEAEMDALILEPLNRWPNFVVICGDEGCGVYWTMVGSPPQETVWLHIED